MNIINLYTFLLFLNQTENNGQQSTQLLQHTQTTSLANVYNIWLLSDTLNTGCFNYTKEMAADIANKSGNIYQLTYEDLLLVTICTN
jgi:hypothetical protein